MTARKRPWLEMKMPSNISKMLWDEKTTDLTLICGDEKVRVHSFILLANSPVFYSMLTADMVEKNKKEVTIPDARMDVLREMIQYMYTFEISPGFEPLQDLLVLANKYSVMSLVKQVSLLLATTQMSPTTALQLGILGETHEAEDLVKAAARFIASNMSSLDQGIEGLQTSPRLLARILEVVRDGRQRKLVVDRFPTPDFSTEYAYTGKKDAIQFRVDWEAPSVPVLPSLALSPTKRGKGRKKMKTEARPESPVAAWCPLYLTGVGLYGTAQAGEILKVRLRVLVANSKTVLASFDKEVVSQGLGEVVEVELPVLVRLQPGTEYILVQEISDGASITVGRGARDKVELDIPDCLVRAMVTFASTDISNNFTDVWKGVLPRLIFKTDI